MSSRAVDNPGMPLNWSLGSSLTGPYTPLPYRGVQMQRSASFQRQFVIAGAWRKTNFPFGNNARIRPMAP